MWYAIDFGTSNSLLSFVEKGESSKLINLENNAPVLRSIIFTPSKGEYFFGAEAIDEYQDLGGEGRFFRSLKKFLPEPSFKGTEVFGKRMKIEELIAVFLRELKTRADKETGHQVTNVVLGRPALYSLDLEKDQLAEDRMRSAAELAGFKRIEFCAEPIAAGLSGGKDIQEKLILVCDFGGGTSDFTLLKVGKDQFSKDDVQGLSGVFVAGDAIDGRVMRNFVSTHFGKDIQYKTPIGNNTLGFPRRLLGKLSNPAHISFLKERDTWEFLKEIEQWTMQGEDQRYISQLFCLVEEDLGYPVYAKIEKSKIELGKNEQSVYQFSHPGIKIEMPISKVQFEESVEGELSDIFKAMEKVFSQSGLEYSNVDQVRITGGTGQMPLIQDYLIKIFGRDKIVMSEAFQSVALGLGKYAEGLD
ncbi:Hsp70 family protein [Halobacteriovorax sp. GB3]|uniref:Hsp70 family protein n=1 Tax=Halobacteriovorax sp. GB3 TaxID=2719615 RepID=UPI00235F194C|nr:Hsp70 family protein [Halobacteriovorax sp. GB3]MDD0854001.1 Hsp70 family protein [Halobacteriovorax sp. GB3]